MTSTTEELQTHVEVLDITPELAEEWLAANLHNRPIRDARVVELAEAMLRGEWRFNGEAMKFARVPEGTEDAIEAHGEWWKLDDGQHRLLAVVDSGVTIAAVVVWGLDDHAQETMDTGAQRSVSDMLKLRGETETSNLAATLRYVHRYLSRQDFRRDRVRETAQQVLATLNEHPDVREALRQAGHVEYKIPHVPKSVTGALFYLCGGIDENDRDEFFRQAASGENMATGHPIFELRKRLVRNAAAPSNRMNSYEIAAIIVKAWNLWRTGRTIKLLSWKSGGSTVEAFPLLHGFEETWGADALAAEVETAEAA